MIQSYCDELVSGSTLNFCSGSFAPGARCIGCPPE
jgi:hypothetical protein